MLASCMQSQAPPLYVAIGVSKGKGCVVVGEEILQ